MSAQSVRAFEQYRAAQGRPVVRRLGLREAAKSLRARAAELLRDAAELDEAADKAGEPK